MSEVPWFHTGAQTGAATVMIAERGADLLLGKAGISAPPSHQENAQEAVLAMI